MDFPNQDWPKPDSPKQDSPNQDSPRRDSPSRPLVRTLGSDVVGSLQSLLGTIVIAVFVITFVVQAFQIPSQSMENTLLSCDYLLVNKRGYGGGGVGGSLLR